MFQGEIETGGAVSGITLTTFLLTILTYEKIILYEI